MLSRRAFSSLLLATALAPSEARAQNFPPLQVRMVVPFPPGGATDILGRVVGQQLQTMWGNTVLIENKPGASGLVGARQVMAQPGDGASLLLASTGTILAVASQSKERPYDVRRDLMPISLMAAPPYILVVNPKLPVKTAAELVAYGKTNKLSYGSSGVGAGSAPSSASLRFTSSRVSARPTSAEMRAARLAGIAAGAKTPNQATELKPGKPVSATVGMSGNSGERSRPVVPIGRKVPAGRWPTTTGAGANIMSMRPPSRSVTAGPLPR